MSRKHANKRMTMTNLSTANRDSEKQRFTSVIGVLVAIYLEKTRCSRKPIPCSACQADGKAIAPLIMGAMETAAKEALKIWVKNVDPDQISLFTPFSETTKLLKQFVESSPAVILPEKSNDVAQAQSMGSLGELFEIMKNRYGSPANQLSFGPNLDKKVEEEEPLLQLIRRERK